MMTEMSTRRTRRQRLLIGAITLAMTAMALTSVRSDEGHTHPSDTAEQLGQGVALIQARKLYLSACADCHGARGHGTDKAVIDFADAQVLVELTREKVLATLAEGHATSGDVELGEAERAAVTAYLRNYLMLPAPDADTEIGRAIYARSCSVCHGDRGDAASWAKNSLAPPPADFTTHGLDQLARQEMIDAVAFGRDGTAMVGFATQLSRAEIAATVDFIRAAFMPEKSSKGAHDHGHRHDDGDGHDDHASAGFPDGVDGDPAWGKAFYNANCAECHGKDGDGVGPRAYFMIIKPANFLSRESRAKLTRPVLFQHVAEGIVGTTMPAWNKVLTDKQIASVSEYVFQAFLHPEKAAEDDRAPGWRAADPAAEDAKKK